MEKAKKYHSALKKTGTVLMVVGIVLMGVGAALIAGIFATVILSGGWNQTPSIIREFGIIIGSFSDIPILGNFVWLLWIVVFIGPGAAIRIFGDYLQSR